MLRLYHYEYSPSCYKVRLLLAQLGRACELIPVDLQRDEQFSEEFQRISMNRKVPLLVSESGEPISESAAILCHLAEGAPLFPSDPSQRSHVMQWLFYEQWGMGRSLGFLYAWTVLWQLPLERTGELAPYRRRGVRLLSELDRHLQGREFMLGAQYTIADIALYGYAHLAPAAGLDLGPLVHVRRWLERVRSQPGHIEFCPPPASSRREASALPDSLRGGGGT